MLLRLRRVVRIIKEPEIHARKSLSARVRCAGSTLATIVRAAASQALSTVDSKRLRGRRSSEDLTSGPGSRVEVVIVKPVEPLHALQSRQRSREPRQASRWSMIFNRSAATTLQR